MCRIGKKGILQPTTEWQEQLLFKISNQAEHFVQ